MKAILVIDEMPVTCLSCPFTLSHICEVEKITVGEIMDGTITRHESCPLRPLPCKKYMRQIPSDVLEMGKQKRDFIIHKVDVDNSYVEGWNDCLDEIVGETE